MEMNSILAFIGVALMSGGTFVTSAICVAIAAGAAIGSMKKNPDGFGLYIALSALCSSQGLYGFVGFIFMQPFLTPEITFFQGITIFFLGIIMLIAAIFTGLKQSEICANGIKAIGEGHNVFAATMVLAVFPELFAILSLLVTILVGGMI